MYINSGIAFLTSNHDHTIITITITAELLPVTVQWRGADGDFRNTLWWTTSGW